MQRYHNLNSPNSTFFHAVLFGSFYLKPKDCSIKVKIKKSELQKNNFAITKSFVSNLVV